MAKQSKEIKKTKKEKKETQTERPVEKKIVVQAVDFAPKFIFEEKLKAFLAVILFFLFLLLFGSVAWYFLTQVDTALVNGATGFTNFSRFITFFL